MEIAIIAHDGKKAEMVQFLNENAKILHRNEISLVSTGTTGNKVEKAGFQVTRLLSGPVGGDAQIAARVAEGKCQMVIFSVILWRNIHTSPIYQCSCACAMSITFL